MSKEEILKKIVIDIWKTIKLNDPPSWTEKQQQEWLVNRLEEALDTMRDETIKELKKPRENTRGYLVEGEPCPFCKGTGDNPPNIMPC